MLVGVLGGMGPSATVDFLDKLTRLTAAQTDRDHVKYIALSDPDIPDRSAAIAGQGPSPEPALRQRLRQLTGAGAKIIVMPCNSAHYWFEALQSAAPVPMLSIISATVAGIRDAGVPVGARIGLLATSGTLAAGIYHRPLIAAGYVPFALDGPTHERLVMTGIGLIKAGRIEEGRRSLDAALGALLDHGCTDIILGCTDISVAFGHERAWRGLRLHDSNLSLARALLSQLRRGPKT